MRKLLLASSALVALSAASTAALAQTAIEEREAMRMMDNGFDLQVHGFLTHGIFFGSKHPDGNIGIQHRTDGNELQFVVAKTLDNGMSIEGRAEVVIDGKTSASIDEAYFLISGGFGSVRIGNDDPESDLLGVGAPSSALFSTNAGGLANRADDGDAATDDTGTVGISGDADTTAKISGDANKVSYRSPSFAGVQVGISYTPDTGATGSGGATSGAPASDNNAVAVVARYDGDFGGVGLKGAIGYEGGKKEGDNISQLGIGVNVSYSGGTVGVAYRSSEDKSLADDVDARNSQKSSTIGFGGSYSFGDALAGIRYHSTTVDAVATGEKDGSNSRLELYGNYSLSPGLDVGAIVRSDNVKEVKSADATSQASYSNTTFGVALSMFF